MGFVGTFLELIGFGFGIPIGLLIGYFIFIFYNERKDVKEPIVRPLIELDSKSLHKVLPEIPAWLKNPDYDRVDWMNKFLFDMWPYLNKGICNTIRVTLRPIFDQYIGKYCIESIDFDDLTLGSFPPMIHGIKVIETQENELVIEPRVRWAGNCSVTVSLKLLSFKFTVQLLDLQTFLAPRITLKPLVSSFPCFASIIVSLVEKPFVDFGLKLLGADIMAIPILYRFAQDKIASEISNLYHWPNDMEIPILDNLSLATKKPVGILHVKVVRAINLLKMDILGKSDPYVKLSLSEDRLPSKKTSVKMSNLNPEWYENFKFIVKDPQTQVLQLHLYDWEKVKAHDKLGMQVVPLSSLVPHEMKEITLDLLKNMNPNDPHNKKDRGKLVLELTFEPFREEFSGVLGGERKLSGLARSYSLDSTSGSGVLSVNIESAEHVEGKHHNNPYAVILFRGETKKTKAVKRSRDPRWNEGFQFMLEEPPVNDFIHIEVISKRRGFNFYGKESLGHVDLKLADVINNGRINEKFHLINSKNGVIHVELTWSTV
ncbi:synaptotagmin-3-like [Phalaenopsis equestris]|uniref:synaptotagmin-3-like n=1 Tax=Phalaenopsis equestris TaxID=78828 RepID=UPI0009E2301F|nr:synaptotagmin-3-like [Phalaenopsis equestris]XP_020592365.1 synaptotagmin-3-like [Phalaenopsis equestris]XP_020592366.1 synaptotagmin-3-like [Phalaenopsis equestris]